MDVGAGQAGVFVLNGAGDDDDAAKGPGARSGAGGGAGGGAAAQAGVAVIKRRSAIACRRCRRMRSKCLHNKATPPCQGCAEAGIPAEECIFPVRGQPDMDREYRHPRQRADRNARREAGKPRRDMSLGSISMTILSTTPSGDNWELLPPVEDRVEAAKMFTTRFFQLGFIPKQRFIRQIAADDKSLSVFLLLSMLSVSARYVPSLKQRYGDSQKAVNEFMDRASRVALTELYKEPPTLEACQAFYLLACAQQGSGLRNKSSVNMAIAIRMATLMRLHREDIYDSAGDDTEKIIRAESARRTLWMLHSQDNLWSGPASPISLPASDITALLPCDEKDFEAGTRPAYRAALEGTQPGLAEPRLVSHPHRSLFASLIQVHNFWGTIARRVVDKQAKQDRKEKPPWEANSDFAIMSRRLQEWEDSLPAEHTWSEVLLSGYKAHNLDLAYLAVTMATQLCNIVIRKAYLPSMCRARGANRGHEAYFREMAASLFQRVRSLHTQIKTSFGGPAPPDSTGAQMAAFCVYSCGLLACHLCKYPQMDPAGGQDGPEMFRTAVSILEKSQHVWPLAARWLDGLEKFNEEKRGTLAKEGSMADGHDPEPRPLLPSVPSIVKDIPTTVEVKAQPTSPIQQRQGSVPQLNPLPLPEPQLYVDPTMRLPTPQPIKTPSSPYVPYTASASQSMMPPITDPYIQNGIPLPPNRIQTDGFGLLLEAYNHQSANTMNLSGPACPTPPLAQEQQHPQAHGNAALYMPRLHDTHTTTTGGLLHEHYFSSPPFMPGNDGYESELQFFVGADPSQTFPAWGLPVQVPMPMPMYNPDPGPVFTNRGF